MFDHLLESSHRDDSNKWSNIGFCQEIWKLASIEVYFTHLIWSSAFTAFIHLICIVPMQTKLDMGDIYNMSQSVGLVVLKNQQKTSGSNFYSSPLIDIVVTTSSLI